MKTSDFDYSLPPDRIAQSPVEPRDASRLLVLDRSRPDLQHRRFRDIDAYLQPGDLLVLNRTRVLPARLAARKIPTGGRIEVLLLHQLDAHTWEVMVGGKGLSPGRRVAIEAGPEAEIVAQLSGPRRQIRFDQPIEAFFDRIGRMPLPPYIHETPADPERYQTVYADRLGSAAAPTAGLHFTPELIQSLQAAGIGLAYVTLHVGLDTFAPVRVENPHEHEIHTEWCRLPAETAAAINRARAAGRRVVCVGTTSVRTLETAARHSGTDPLGAFEGATDLYILPGYQFQLVDALITNFHLPKSTLLMMISAFAGQERVQAAYQAAIREQYRFYSFGDAMLIL